MTTTSIPIHVQVPFSIAYEWMKTPPSKRVEKLSEFFGVALPQETKITQIYDGFIELTGSKKLGTIKDCPVMTGQFKVSSTKTALILSHLTDILNMTSGYDGYKEDIKVWVKITDSGYAEAKAKAIEAKAIATDATNTADKDKNFEAGYEAGYKQAISDVLEKFRECNRKYSRIGCEDSDEKISDAQSSAEAIDTYLDQVDTYLDQTREQLETLTSELEAAQEEIDEVLSESADFHEFLNDKFLEQILKKD